MYQAIRVYLHCFLSQYIYFDGYIVYNCVLVLTFSRWNLAGAGVRLDGAVGGDLGVPSLRLSSVVPDSPGNLAPCGLSNNNNNNNNNNTSLLVPSDMGKLGTRISVISVETAHRNNLAARWSNEYRMDLIQSWYAANYDMKVCCCYGL